MRGEGRLVAAKRGGIIDALAEGTRVDCERAVKASARPADDGARRERHEMRVQVGGQAARGDAGQCREHGAGVSVEAAAQGVVACEAERRGRLDRAVRRADGR